MSLRECISMLNPVTAYHRLCVQPFCNIYLCFLFRLPHLHWDLLTTDCETSWFWGAHLHGDLL